MIVLTAYYYARPGALKRMAPLVKEQEPGCTLYQAARSWDNPDVFLLYEQYADEAALLAHHETPHFKEIIEGTIIPLLQQRERRLYTLVVG